MSRTLNFCTIVQNELCCIVYACSITVISRVFHVHSYTHFKYQKFNNFQWCWMMKREQKNWHKFKDPLFAIVFQLWNMSKPRFPFYEHVSIRTTRNQPTRLSRTIHMLNEDIFLIYNIREQAMGGVFFLCMNGICNSRSNKMNRKGKLVCNRKWNEKPIDFVRDDCGVKIARWNKKKNIAQ